MYVMTGLLGLALMIAPYTLGYTNVASAYWTSMLIGGVTLFLSLIESLEQYDIWEYWAAGFLGLLAVAAPFVFGFSSDVSTMRFMVSAGLLMAVLSGAVIYHDRTNHTERGVNGI